VSGEASCRTTSEFLKQIYVHATRMHSPAGYMASCCLQAAFRPHLSASAASTPVKPTDPAKLREAELIQVPSALNPVKSSQCPAETSTAAFLHLAAVSPGRCTSHAQDFLATSQLTYHGLTELHAALEPMQLAVFFRNNHFGTVSQSSRTILFPSTALRSQEPSNVLTYRTLAAAAAAHGSKTKSDTHSSPQQGATVPQHRER
jgi:hypothetical protein